MSATIYAALKLEIAQYQAALAKARGETERWKAQVKNSTSDLGREMFGGMLKADLAMAGLSRGVGVMDSFVRRGIEFNATMDNSAVGIANVLRKFDGLNAAAARDEAAKAMQKIIELEPRTAGSLADLTSGFMQTLATAKGVGLTTEQNVVMVSKFANALANAGLSVQQLGQEYRSILSGNITADSAIAKILGITNEEVAQIKANGGDLFDFLNGKLGEFGEAGDSAAVAWSSFQSSLDKAAGAFTAGIFTEGVASAKELASWLEQNQTLFRDLGSVVKGTAQVAVTALQLVSTAAKEAGYFMGAAFGNKTAFENGKFVQLSTIEAYKRIREEAAAAGKAMNAAGAAAGSPAAAGAAGGSRGSSVVPVPTKNETNEIDKAFEAFKRNEELKQQIARDGMNTAQRVADAKKRLAAAEARENELKNDPFSGGAYGLQAMEAERERLKIQQELNRLIQQQGVEIDAVKAKMADEMDRAAERWKAQDAAKETLRQELAMAEAKARGDTNALERMERELKIREKAKQIEEQAGVTAAQARASAEKLIFLEEQAAKKADSKSSGGDSEYTKDGRKKIKGVQASHYMKSGLDQFYADQVRDGTDATALGANSLTNTAKKNAGGGDMLSGKASQNVAANEAVERAMAAGGRDPAVVILGKMFELWQKELAQ